MRPMGIGASRLGDAIRQRPWFAAWLTLIPFVLLRAGTLAESDTFWQIRTGLLTMSTRAIPTTDPFSWTAHGEPWTLNSWGFNVLLAVAYRVAGLPGVALASASLVAVTLWLVLALARKAGADPFVSAVLLQVSCALLIPYFSARPQLVDYTAVLLLVLLLSRLVGAGGPPVRNVFAIGIIMVVWVNMHAAAPLGVALLGAVTALVVVNRSTRRRAGWCFIALLVAAGCTLANPYGAGGFAQSIRVADASKALITEWQPLDPTSPLQLSTFLAGLLALGVAVRRRDAVFSAVLGVTAAGAVGAMRMLPLLLLVALPVLASVATRPTVMRYIASRRVMLTQGAVLGLGVLAVIAASALTHIGRPYPPTYSSAVVAVIPRDCTLFNSYLLGGFVILKRPDVRVSIDSRNDMYGAERVKDSYRALSRRPGGDLVGAGCVMIPPTTQLARWLRRSDDWKTVKSDKSSVLFVRR